MVEEAEEVTPEEAAEAAHAAAEQTGMAVAAMAPEEPVRPNIDIPAFLRRGGL
jgi:hypothetical protein